MCIFIYTYFCTLPILSYIDIGGAPGAAARHGCADCLVAIILTEARVHLQCFGFPVDHNHNNNVNTV